MFAIWIPTVFYVIFSDFSSPIWDPEFKQTVAPHLGNSKAAVLAAASGSSDSDSLSSRYPTLYSQHLSACQKILYYCKYYKYCMYVTSFVFYVT